MGRQKEQKLVDDAQRAVWHFATSPGEAACENYGPNECLTDTFANVTCGLCRMRVAAGGKPLRPTPAWMTWETALAIATELLVTSEKSLDDITGWSGGSGNWPAQEAHPKVLLALRALRGEIAPGELHELAPLAARIAAGRAKYANGCTVLSLADETGEVLHSVNKYEKEERVRDELLDVAAVAMRLYLGEIDRGLQLDGLVQKRTDGDDGT